MACFRPTCCCYLLKILSIVGASLGIVYGVVTLVIHLIKAYHEFSSYSQKQKKVFYARIQTSVFEIGLSVHVIICITVLEVSGISILIWLILYILLLISEIICFISGPPFENGERNFKLMILAVVGYVVILGIFWFFWSCILRVYIELEKEEFFDED